MTPFFFSGLIFDLLFSNLLYPCKPMLLFTSTFLTTVMAHERYSAIRHPIAYRNTSLSACPWRTAFCHAMACASAAALFVIPLVFESEVRWQQMRTISNFNETHALEVGLLKDSLT